MIGIPETDKLQTATISAVIHEGLTVQTRNGKKARLAIIDEDGNILEAGDTVAQEAWNVSIASFKNFMRGQGHLRIHSTPPKANFAAA